MIETAWICSSAKRRRRRRSCRAFPTEWTRRTDAPRTRRACPAARADRESTATRYGSIAVFPASRCARLVPEVEKELGLVTRCGEQLVELQSRAPARDDLPPIPEYGQGAYRLEVTDIEPSSVEGPNVASRARTGRSRLPTGPRGGSPRDARRGTGHPAGEDLDASCSTHWDGVGCALALDRVRDRDHEHDEESRCDVEDEVVGRCRRRIPWQWRGEHEEAYGEVCRSRRGGRMPTATFQPKCRLGKATYWFVSQAAGARDTPATAR